MKRKTGKKNYFILIFKNLINIKKIETLSVY